MIKFFSVSLASRAYDSWSKRSSEVEGIENIESCVCLDDFLFLGLHGQGTDSRSQRNDIRAPLDSYRGGGCYIRPCWYRLWDILPSIVAFEPRIFRMVLSITRDGGDSCAGSGSPSDIEQAVRRQAFFCIFLRVLRTVTPSHSQ